MTVKQKQCLLTFLGYDTGGIDGIWGEKSRNALECCQEDLGLVADGVWGQQTETAILEAVYTYDVDVPAVVDAENAMTTEAWWDEIEYFSPPEFGCQCWKYTKYCDGWPHEMQEKVVRICDRARKHFGQPISIISGLRCEKHNAAPYVKGVVNSQHMYGEAADIYVWNVNPDTVLAWFLSQSDVRYAYRIAGSNNIHFDIEKVGR